MSHRQLGEIDAAIRYYDRALEFDPAAAKALEEALELRKTKGDHIGVERLLNARLDQAKNGNDRAAIVRVTSLLAPGSRLTRSNPTRE